MRSPFRWEMQCHRADVLGCNCNVAMFDWLDERSSDGHHSTTIDGFHHPMLYVRSDGQTCHNDNPSAYRLNRSKPSVNLIYCTGVALMSRLDNESPFADLVRCIDNLLWLHWNDALLFSDHTHCIGSTPSHRWVVSRARVVRCHRIPSATHALLGCVLSLVCHEHCVQMTIDAPRYRDNLTFHLGSEIDNRKCRHRHNYEDIWLPGLLLTTQNSD